MTKTIVLISFIAFAALYSNAQTKIFKEVDGEVLSQMRTIRQDNILIGYLVFTQLEKATEDSFNYRITILDENLNDIGTVNFRQLKLDLQAVAFEQDVLCLGYLKTNLIGYTFKSKQEFRAALDSNQTAIYTQFIGLDGKIIKTNSVAANITIADAKDEWWVRAVDAWGILHNTIQLQNISETGFACFYGDRRNHLMVFDTKGNVLWKKQVTEETDGYKWDRWHIGAVYMATFGNNIYLISNKYEWGHSKPQSGMFNFELLGFSAIDTTKQLQYPLSDEKDNQLRLFYFKNDPSTGKPCITGMIANKNEKFLGVCTITIGGLTSSDVHWVNSYWDDDIFDAPADSKSIKKDISDLAVKYSFRGFNGHSYFTAYTYASGSEFMEQNEKGMLSVKSNILSESDLHPKPLPFHKNDNDNRSFYSIVSADAKICYLIVDDPRTVSIYNVNQQKVQRTIPHKDGDTKITVFPAKDGYIMVSEYNKKEKYTKFSIEAL